MALWKIFSLIFRKSFLGRRRRKNLDAVGIRGWPVNWKYDNTAKKLSLQEGFVLENFFPNFIMEIPVGQLIYSVQ